MKTENPESDSSKNSHLPEEVCILPVKQVPQYETVVQVGPQETCRTWLNALLGWIMVFLTGMVKSGDKLKCENSLQTGKRTK